jgi:putative CRISPR-associated protein (TIGR02619 family)
MSRRFVLSTVGTSLFSNVLEISERPIWNGRLNLLSNTITLPPDVAVKVDELRQRARARLHDGDVPGRRLLSAELNGIYGLYNDGLPSGEDVHYLIATDTALGRAAADVVCDFLRQHNINASIHVPETLNTESPASFSQGMKNLLTWCEQTIPGFRASGYEVVFNLTGGFKSLQGYLNIIGMFYADRLVYIFETGLELLSIPKLPIRVDIEQLQAQADKLALLGAGASMSREEMAHVPDTLLRLRTNGEATLSEWGALIWNRMKHEVLAAQLIAFPHLHYEPSFHKDFEKATPQQRVTLQETLAEASAFLLMYEGNSNVLREHGGLQYDNYTNKRTRAGCPIGHFRITQGDRVSCTAEDRVLRLRHFGVHDYVNGNP